MNLCEPCAVKQVETVGLDIIARSNSRQNEGGVMTHRTTVSDLRLAEGRAPGGTALYREVVMDGIWFHLPS